jgi:O-antigen/teichoic acid export membrane protein
MGLRRNILASYAGQGYVTLVSIAALPLYLRYLGAEAYGLVGFFTMMQAWFMLLDMGLTPTLSRETARFHGGALAAGAYRSLVRVLEAAFVGIALAGAAALAAGSGAIATRWLQASALPLAEVERALHIMAAILALRWMCGLYRSILSGAERLEWLAGFSAAFATLRFVGVLIALHYVGATATVFFVYQLAVAAVELAVLARHARALLPADAEPRHWRVALATVRPLVTFSMSLAFTSSVWIFVTQTDKLLLSRMLPLSEYGYFTLAVLVAGGVTVISGPVSAAVMPRMARLEAEHDGAALVDVYRRSTQFVVAVATAASLTLALAARPLLHAWTGDATLADHAAPVLVPYALGNGLLAVSAFPYYLQYAKGNLRMHLIGSALFVLLLIPLIVLAARQYGGVGAGYAWLIINGLYLVTWVPLVHRRLQPGLNRAWFLRDIGVIALPAAAAGVAVASLLSADDGRGMVVAKTVVLLTSMGIVGAAFTSAGCEHIRLRWLRWLGPHRPPEEGTQGG